MPAYCRFVRGFPAFLNRRISLSQAEEALQRRMGSRRARFLRLVKSTVFGNPTSPYRTLFEMADCTFGDLEQSVRRRGLEGALHELYEAGVYVSFEEFKGRRPIVRQGREIQVGRGDFDNPFLSAYCWGGSSGTTGAATRTAIDLENILEGAPLVVVAYAAHDVLGLPTAYWRGILPGLAGLRGVLRSFILGNPPRRWFSPIRNGDVNQPLKHRLGTAAIVLLGRAFGQPVPAPEPLPLDQPGALVNWIRRTLEAEGRCMVYATVSAAARLALAARRRGVSLEGCTVKAGGEPITAAKVRCVKATGASWFPIYGMSEAGFVGMGCPDSDPDDLHFAMDGLALIQRPLEVEGWPYSPNAFFLTSLLATAPKILLNLETDDCGVLEERSCDCPMGKCGLTQHLRGVRSYRKVTGEGVTLLDAEMVRILEEVLPERFGGGPLDYQFVEEEDGRGLTRLNLFVSPDVELSSEAEVIETTLSAVREAGLAGAFSAAFWEQGGSMRLRRREPLWNAGGKFLPLKATESGVS